MKNVKKIVGGVVGLIVFVIFLFYLILFLTR